MEHFKQGSEAVFQPWEALFSRGCGWVLESERMEEFPLGKMRLEHLEPQILNRGRGNTYSILDQLPWETDSEETCTLEV